MSTKTHNAVATVAVHAPLGIIQVPTVTPTGNEVRVRVEWTASTPLDLHQNDGGLLVKHPQVLGDGVAGTVVEVGPEAKRLKVGDKVFGFTWRNQQEKAYQEFATTTENLLGLLPAGHTLEEAVVLGNNFVTVFHAVTTDLELPLDWPIPKGYVPEHADDAILIWGGSSSVGQYALQILRHYGYRNLITTASKAHHDLLKSLGAKQAFDYRDEGVISRIKSAVGPIPFILDCIGSLHNSMVPLTQLAARGSKVAILLPVIVRDSTATTQPEYSMDVVEEVQKVNSPWAEGVDARGVRTHFYLDNKLFADKLQSEIMPSALSEGWVVPNKRRIVEGKTLLERAQKALDLLRDKAVSGERLVWRVSDNV